MVGLPKSIIKKYGVTKKAWAVFRENKTTTRKTKTRRSEPMAKRRTSRGRSSGAFSSNKMMNGFYKPSGMLGNALMGIGAATVAAKIPVNVPYKGVIAAGIVGGLPGAGAVFLMQTLNGSTTDSSSDLVNGY